MSIFCCWGRDRSVLKPRGTAHTQRIRGEAGSAGLGALRALRRTLDLIHMGHWEQMKDFDWRSIMGPSPEKNEVSKITRAYLQSQRTPVDFPGGPVVKNLPANTGTRIQSLVWKDSTCQEQPNLRATTTEAHAAQSPCCSQQLERVCAQP